jgi:hypothetical protein
MMRIAKLLIIKEKQKLARLMLNVEQTVLLSVAATPDTNNLWRIQ